MTLVIKNPIPMISADPRVVGAAVKIIMAAPNRGWENLSDTELQRASGVSEYVWKSECFSIAAMLARLDTDQMAQVG